MKYPIFVQLKSTSPQISLLCIYIYVYRYKNKKITIQQNYSKDQNQYYNNNNFATRRNIVRSQKKKNYFTNESKRTCTLIPIKMQLSAKIRKCIFFLFFLLSFFPPPPFFPSFFIGFQLDFTRSIDTNVRQSWIKLLHRIPACFLLN